MTLKRIVDADASAQVQKYEIASRATIESARDASTQQTALMLRILEMSQSRAVAPPPAPDPTILSILQAQADATRAMQAMLTRIVDDEGDRDETDDQRLERVIEDYRREGLSAVQEYLEEETVMSFLTNFPKLRQRLPDLAAKVRPMLEAAWASLLGDTKGPASPVAAPPPSRDTHSPRVE